MGRTAGMGFVVRGVVGAIVGGFVTLAGVAAPPVALAQSTPDPAVRKLIEGRLSKFVELTELVNAAGDDQTKLAGLAKKIAATVEQTYSDYQELNTSWDADQKQLVIDFGKDAGNDVMRRLMAAADKANAAVKTSGTGGCTECVPLVLVPGCQVRCCKGDESPSGSNLALTPWECPPVEEKTCTQTRPGCPG